MQQRIIATTQKENGGINVARYVFACLIPLLHIPFEGGFVIDFLRQYVARLGVPFFFAVSGMMLNRSIGKRGPKTALARYEKRILTLLIFWLAIYSPLILVGMRDTGILKSIQTIVFLTPAFLWYLTALAVATVPFCLISNKRILYIGGVLLYLVGTLFGGSYTWLLGRVAIYEDIFLTTRNGVFFAFPMMCAGKLLDDGHFALHGWKKFLLPLLAIILLWIEISIVQGNMLPGADCSMYLLLPVVTVLLISAVRETNISFDTKWMRGASSAIYLMQFGIISVLQKVLGILQIPMGFGAWMIYIAVIIVPTVCYLVLCKTKLAKLF